LSNRDIIKDVMMDHL